MHIVLSFYTFLEDRESMLESVLEILDASKYILSENRDPKLQCYSLWNVVKVFKI